MSYLFENYVERPRLSPDTSFEHVKCGADFPSDFVKYRNCEYMFNHKLYSGDYARGKYLTLLVNQIEHECPYRTVPLNYFETVTNKLESLLFNNNITVKTGDSARDKRIESLMLSCDWIHSIRKGVKNALIYGDSILKTYRRGVSALTPLHGFKVVDSSDKDLVKGVVLHELLYDSEGTPTHIRILISSVGFEYERVYEYVGDSFSGKIGKPVRWKYRGRWIPVKGRYYFTEISDASTVQWLSLNTEKNLYYGSSCFDNIKQIVFHLERRLATEAWVVDNHSAPLLTVSMQSIQENELTGRQTLKVVDGKYLINHGEQDSNSFKYIEWDGKLDASKSVRDSLMSALYELSELGRCFLSGELSISNISEETLNNIIKTALDRAARILNDLYLPIRDSLYVLCRLNGIEVLKDDLNISFNIGQVDDAKTIAQVCTELSTNNMMSRSTLLQKFFGYSAEDADEELKKVSEERDKNKDIKIEEVV